MIAAWISDFRWSYSLWREQPGQVSRRRALREAWGYAEWNRRYPV